MKINKKALFSVIIASSLALSACGGSEESSPSGSAQGTESSSSETSSENPAWTGEDYTREFKAALSDVTSKLNDYNRVRAKYCETVAEMNALVPELELAVNELKNALDAALAVKPTEEFSEPHAQLKDVVDAFKKFGDEAILMYKSTDAKYLFEPTEGFAAANEDAFKKLSAFATKYGELEPYKSLAMFAQTEMTPLEYGKSIMEFHQKCISSRRAIEQGNPYGFVDGDKVSQEFLQHFMQECADYEKFLDEAKGMKCAPKYEKEHKALMEALNGEAEWIKFHKTLAEYVTGGKTQEECDAVFEQLQEFSGNSKGCTDELTEIIRLLTEDPEAKGFDDMI